MLSVVNSGPVIAPAEVERLLQPFQRLSPDRTSRGDGLGLGLSIVKALAEAHGATLNVRTRPEGGLDVEVSFLPIASSSLPAPVVAAPAVAAPVVAGAVVAGAVVAAPVALVTGRAAGATAPLPGATAPVRADLLG